MFFQVNRDSDLSFTRQIYEQVREAILSGGLQAGEKVGSTRELAASLGVSRNVTLEAYERLIAEGYLEVRPRSGTYVAQGSSLQTMPDYVKLSSPTKEPEQKHIDFKAGNPAMDQFPRAKWGSLAKEVCQEAPDYLFGYTDAMGVMELRRILAAYLLRVRGVRCQPEQIVITSGATQALHMITELLAKDGASIAVEDPVTDEMRSIFTRAGAKVYPVRVDENGMLPDALPNERPSFVFVIPSHQFPLGGTLSIQRRVQLVEYVRRMDSFLVEDDYDSEFTYEGIAVPAIQGLDAERVVYVGTFSKILSPSLRIGYAVLPQRLIEPFRQLKWFSDRHTGTLEQLILARFIERGYLERHVRRMKKIYRERREALVNSLQSYFVDAKIVGQAAGMHLVVELPGMVITEEFVASLRERGVIVYPVERYALQKGYHCNQIVMGYGSIPVSIIKKGVALLWEVAGEFYGNSEIGLKSDLFDKG